MSVQIITESACDMPAEEAKALNVTILPLTTAFGEHVYQDGVTISHREFFEKLIETDVMPTTSQVTPLQYAEAFRKVKEAGDTAVCITLSSKLSGCYNSAQIAQAEGYEDCVTIVDTENVTIGELLLIKLAVRARDEGKSAAEIASMILAAREKVRVIGLLDTLEYLKRGGRISTTVAFAGALLSIKPVVMVTGGLVEMAGKARGSKNGNNLLTKLVAESGGIDFSLPYALAYSGLSDALLQKYLTDQRALYEGQAETLPIYTIGSTIGTHVGPGAIAVAFFARG